MMIRSVEISCPDGVVLKGDYYDACVAPLGVIVLSGALGVKRKFYRQFASLAAGAGYDVLVHAYRGAEKGEMNRARHPRHMLSDWGRQDISAALAYCRKTRPHLAVYHVGHSIGAQLLGLSAEAPRLKAAAFICGSFPYWKWWSGRRKVAMFLMFWVLIPCVARLPRHVAARLLGLGVSRGLLLEWSHWVRDKKYLLSRKFCPAARTSYASLEIPIVSFVFEDDAYVPRQAAQRMHEAYESAALDVRYKNAGEGAVGHFGFFKNEVLQGELLEYFRQQSR